MRVVIKHCHVSAIANDLHQVPGAALTVSLQLQDAVSGGWFRTTNSTGPNLPVITATAGEIALGMEFLHSQGIVHGDLSSGLQSSARPLCLPGDVNCTESVGRDRYFRCFIQQTASK